MASPETEDVVEVYRTDSDIVARKVVDVLLRPDGISADIHDRKDAMFPGAGQPGSLQIAVPRKDVERARQIITEAVDNGFLDAEEGEAVVEAED